MKKAQAMGGGFMFFIPTLRRERQVVEVRLVYTVKSCQGLERAKPLTVMSCANKVLGRVTCGPLHGKNPEFPFTWLDSIFQPCLWQEGSIAGNS